MEDCQLIRTARRYRRRYRRATLAESKETKPKMMMRWTRKETKPHNLFTLGGYIRHEAEQSRKFRRQRSRGTRKTGPYDRLHGRLISIRHAATSLFEFALQANQGGVRSFYADLDRNKYVILKGHTRPLYSE